MDVKEGLARTHQIAGDPSSGGSVEPAWWGYGNDRRLALLRAVVEALAAGEQFSDDELASMDDLHESLRGRALSASRKEMRDRYAVVELDRTARDEIYRLGNRLSELRASTVSG